MSVIVGLGLGVGCGFISYKGYVQSCLGWILDTEQEKERKDEKKLSNTLLQILACAIMGSYLVMNALSISGIFKEGTQTFVWLCFMNQGYWSYVPWFYLILWIALTVLAIWYQLRSFKKRHDKKLAEKYADALNTVSNYTESKEEEENKDDVSDDDEEDESQVYVEYESDNDDD